MKLRLVNTHLSILDFPEVELPNFTVVTGENGSGKTHMLQAIRDGKIVVDIAPTPSQDVRYFEWQNFVPTDTGAFNSDAFRNERENLRQIFYNARRQQHIVDPVIAAARDAGLTGINLQDIAQLASASVMFFKIHIRDAERAEIAYTNVRSAIPNAEAAVLAQFDAGTQVLIKSIAGKSGKSIMALTDDDFKGSNLPNWGRTELFQQSFGRLFGAYRDTRLRNDIISYQKSQGRGQGEPLSNDEFIEVYGPPPWDFVNRVLKNAGLDFYINQPDEDDYSNFTPKLFSTKSNIQIEFNALSSGEKVLVSFAFCVYYASDTRQIATYPKLILLDEIDAPLHPSMSKTMIETISGTLVNQFGLKVIATTHSPSTVAIASEDAIYGMRKGISGVQKISKPVALNLLTSGVPTLAISYDGRRQVFVESPADAKTYDELYKIFKTRISSERSLEFIATGSRSASGQDSNTGCDNVKRLVTALTEAGNISVYGLLDWDGTNAPSNRMFVLAHKRRNGLENVILDPLLVAALICRDCGKHREIIGLDSSLSLPKFTALSKDKMQEVVTRIGEIVFGGKPKDIALSIYDGGLSLEIDKRFFDTDDHELEKMILSSFPGLNNFSKQKAGQLMQHMISTVLLDYPDLTPREIRDILRSLLE